MGNGLQFILTFSIFISVVNSKGCVKTGQCTCQSDTMKIDLNDLDLKPNEPKFKDVKDPKGSGTNYSYNPCYSFSEGAPCAEAAMVNQHVPNQCFSLGDNAMFVGDPESSTLALSYNKTTGGYLRTAVVKLICKQGVQGNLVSKGETKISETSSTYTFELETEIVCVPSSSGNSGISTGSILVILFFVFFVAYWIGGVIFLKYARGATGKELIPNLEFWTDFPLLIRDGVVFVINGCKPRSTYEQI